MVSAPDSYVFDTFQELLLLFVIFFMGFSYEGQLGFDLMRQKESSYVGGPGGKRKCARVCMACTSFGGQKKPTAQKLRNREMRNATFLCGPVSEFYLRLIVSVWTKKPRSLRDLGRVFQWTASLSTEPGWPVPVT